ncbi:hypothetical protein BDQ94DRAFT_145404 [Aspergillus welwitschiae]|uniref:Uncharacterized protein n=1 Tax=Aspergillus welwitschiae TaxID=1341132 RepID=A0A3F3Q053_9EURO|nr:hypothetical protein BDQ94DRAFT_145404 [Aspergillus welwitschiae]RDH32540.1 hypothetical protein BDQ94DRAFT_145404 [Aspergillus welwitschiae]
MHSTALMIIIQSSTAQVQNLKSRPAQNNFPLSISSSQPTPRPPILLPMLHFVLLISSESRHPPSITCFSFLPDARGLHSVCALSSLAVN